MKRFLTVAVLLFLGIAACGAIGSSIGSTAVTTYDAAASAPQLDDATDQPADAPRTTTGQSQALRSAESYLSLSGFSKAGLMQQLTSPAGEGYSKADARYALRHLNADWNAEAVESAESYLQISSFSRSGLIQQLHSRAGSGFTLKQATYAADKVGL